MNTNTAKQIENRAEDQARAQVESIVEMVAAFEKTEFGREDAEQTIQEDPLSVEVRTDWHTLDAEDTKPTQFRILLCWGGPAVQIVGDLTEHGEPKNPVVQYQDYGTPWTDYRNTTDEQREALLTYCRAFYFGE